MKRILLLGASGSIGRQTLDIIEEYPDKFLLVAFSVGKHTEVIEKILKKHKKVQYVYLINDNLKNEYTKKYPNIYFYSNSDGLPKFTRDVDFDMCVNALVGIVGLEPSLITLSKDKILCLANKEALVTGGHLINKLLDDGHGKLYPIDSEHVGFAKCLAHVDETTNIDHLIITASGGALRNVDISKLKDQKASDALKHPTWKMGNKITIDCATMMNKGFELIEAYYLFSYPAEKIEILLHDESLVHAMVKMRKKQIIVDYSKPDMHNPIKYALFLGNAYDEVKIISSLDELKDCHFHAFNPERYPAVSIARRALIDGPSRLVALNAANEVAVNAFLEDKIGYLDIVKIVKDAVKNTPINKNPSLEEIKEIDQTTRKLVSEVINNVVS